MGARGEGGDSFYKKRLLLPPAIPDCSPLHFPCLTTAREDTKKGRDIPPLSVLCVPPAATRQRGITPKTFYGATGLRPNSAGALTFTPWLMLRLSPAGTSTFQNRL